MNIRTFIVDDEPLARKRVRRLLAGEPAMPVVGEYGTGREAVAAIPELAPDLMFLDIQMPGMDGFEVIRSIPPAQMPLVIFVTAYDQHALKAFEVHALDYLLKPFTQERFEHAVSRAKGRLAKDGASQMNPGLAALIEKLQGQARQEYLDRFLVRDHKRVFFVKVAEVDWIESAANYVLLHVGEKTHIIRETMQALEQKLCPKTFQRVSRSVIVNLERVQELQPMGKGQYVIILANRRQLTMSRGIRDLQQALDIR